MPRPPTPVGRRRVKRIAAVPNTLPLQNMKIRSAGAWPRRIYVSRQVQFWERRYDRSRTGHGTKRVFIACRGGQVKPSKGDKRPIGRELSQNGIACLVLKVFVTTRLSGDRHGRWMPNTRSSDRPICVCGPLCGAQHRNVVERHELSQFSRARRGGSGVIFPIWANKASGIGPEHFAFPSNRNVVEPANLGSPTHSAVPRNGIETTRRGYAPR